MSKEISIYEQYKDLEHRYHQLWTWAVGRPGYDKKAWSELLTYILERLSVVNRPIPMILFCPLCHVRHLDEGEFATKPHHTHACQACGFVWRPAVVPTMGVQYLPGFKNA